MRTRFWSGATLSGLALWIASGCGGNDDATQPRFNQTLGGSAVGAPTSVGFLDESINADPTSFKPSGGGGSSGGGSTGSTAAAGGGSGGGESAETEAVRTAAKKPIEAVVQLDAAGILDGFVPAQVEALRADFQGKLGQLFDTLQTTGRIMKEKAPGQPDPTAQIHAALAAAGDAIVVNIIDAENARISLDPKKTGDLAVQWAEQANAASGAAAAPAGHDAPAAPVGGGRFLQNPSAAEDGGGRTSPPPAMPGGMGLPPPEEIRKQAEAMAAMVSVKLLKVENAWRYDLGMTLTEDHADAMGDVVEAAKDLAQKFNDRVAAAPSVDPATLQQIGTEVGMQSMPALIGAFTRLQTVFGAAATDAPRKPEEKPDSASPAVIAP